MPKKKDAPGTKVLTDFLGLLADRFEDRATAWEQASVLFLKWSAILEAFTRFKRGRLRHIEFDGHMLPWRTSMALKCFASNTLYPCFLPTPDGLRIKDLWLYEHQPSLRVLRSLKEDLLPGTLFPDPMRTYLERTTGLALTITED